MGIDAIIALASIALPPVVDFIKKKFLKPEEDTPERTMASLATTKPEVMPEYLKAQAGLLEAKTKYFNRDVCGVPRQIVIDLRAAIRPVGVVISFLILMGMLVGFFLEVNVPPESKPTIDGIRYGCITIIGSWFGDRLSEE